MHVLYNILISVIFLLFLPLSLLYVLFKVKFTIKEFGARLGFRPKRFREYIKEQSKRKRTLIWFHAASLGEVKMAKALIGGLELEEKYPDLNFIVSTNCSAGEQMAERLFGSEKTLLIPLDLPWLIKSLINKTNPKLAIVVEFEVRPNFIYYLSRAGCKVILINGSMDNEILKDYDYFPGLLSTTLCKFDFLGMKTEKEAKEVEKLGAEPSKVKVIENIKMDNLFRRGDEGNRNSLKKRLMIPFELDIIVVGSTHSGEEELIFKIYPEIKKEYENVVLILAPRHINRTKRIMALGESYRLNLIRRTEIDVNNSWYTRDEILLLDTMGELDDLYSIATVVFVGGSLVDKGGHNLFEPVVYGKPVLFGPYTQDFKECTQLLLKNQVGIMVKNKEELKKTVLSLLKNRTQLDLIYDRASKLLETNQGLLRSCTDIIEQFL